MRDYHRWHVQIRHVLGKLQHAAQRKLVIRPISSPVEQGVWKFSRGTDVLYITREPLDDGMALVIAGEGEPRSYFFEETSRLEMFQKDMETLLLKTGWTFLLFEPDRRSGRDRRGWPRRATDRRRWWTDGTTRTRLTREADQAAPVGRGKGKP